MIESCKYCLSSKTSCPRCAGPVITRTITELVPILGYVSCSLILCLTPECQNYGHFQIETTHAVVTIVCDKCRERQQNLRKFQDQLENTFKTKG